MSSSDMERGETAMAINLMLIEREKELERGEIHGGFRNFKR